MPEHSGGRPGVRHVDQLVADAARVTAVIRHADLSAPVAGCPGWDVERLVVHLGKVHRWAHHCVTHATPPASSDGFSPAGRALADWFDEGARTLAATLRTVDPAAPTWHPFPAALEAGVWPRRMAHETAVHRWDAEAAVGDPTTIDAEFASDGIDEYFELAVPRLLDRPGTTAPTGSFHVHCTDVDGEWLVRLDDGRYRMDRVHQKGDAALRGPAEALLLRLWGRRSPTSAELSPVGDDAVLADWLGLAGL